MTKNPQLEDGYTRIANEIMDALSKIRIPGEAMQVLFVILRKTYGFNKKEDTISLSQFHSATGIKKPSIIRAIKLLEAMKLIYKKANRQIASYRFNKDLSSWKPLAKKLTVYQKVNQRLLKSKSAFTKKLPTKDTLTKDTLTKDIHPNSEEFRLAKLLLDLILIRNPGLKKPDLQKWALQVDSMIRLDNRKVDDIEAVIRWCQSGKSAASRFWNNNILSTEKLREQFDQLWMKMPEKDRANRNNGHKVSSTAQVKKSLDQLTAERDEKEGVTC